MKFMQEDKTIHYYNSNAKEFVLGTVAIDFEYTQKKFTDRLSKNAVILDFGCGSGRDTKYFIEKGYQVEAIDVPLNYAGWQANMRELK